MNQIVKVRATHQTLLKHEKFVSMVIDLTICNKNQKIRLKNVVIKKLCGLIN